jgi:acyl dehydratase
MTLTFDRGLLGREFDRTEYGPVTEAEILEFARALGERNPLFVDPAAAAAGPLGGLVAMPAFCLKFRSRRFYPADMPPLSRSGFDAGKDVAFGVPIRPGDRITVSAVVQDLYEKTGRSGAMVFVVVRFTLLNQRAETVAVIDNRFIHRGTADGSRGTADGPGGTADGPGGR